ncbi:AraC family transcriptional regulator [Sinorhizobium medicae]|uniref:AraC family transcriptional regulator n=1 Tax=Sinorhizobium medicae TaxID=110321 RepID=UPI000FD52AB7|nr:AraC family transcriptional regulator [Sinorhizobium medicae]MQX75781.1 helix-turn-helix domain-containing protein [Sinorhizobium medicae]MQX99022.1 helix-turn-helix domain-containing protein [Sinorhizobium medicae]RVI57366.1 AraC family transcriptional regulator [Sinorhizobium medicae]RVJ61820.1 AraC family transcriptional regulator [Sinorhizobium medicae]RVJ78560.1 AraC family transcriptional regulator [Sinorhizobium medicae]
MERRMIAPCFMDDTLECLRRHGVDAGPLLAQVGLPPVITGPVPAEQYGALWHAVAQVMDDEFFGEGARPMRAGSFALLCHAILSTVTLEHALRRALRFLRIVLDDPHGELVVEDGLAQIVLEDAGATRSAFAYRTFWIILHGVNCWLIGRRLPIRWVDFRCSAPPAGTDYRLFFGAPVRFDQPRTRLVFDAEYLKLPPIRDERALKHFLRHAPANILVRYRHDAGLSTAIRRRLQALDPSAWPGFETLAARMRIAAPTLRRRLKQEGQTYRSIKEDLRRTLAMEALAERGQNLAQLAVELGFSEPSAFHRAFRKWTGKSPAQFRRSASETGLAESGSLKKRTQLQES